MQIRPDPNGAIQVSLPWILGWSWARLSGCGPNFDPGFQPYAEFLKACETFFIPGSVTEPKPPYLAGASRLLLLMN